MCYEAFRLTRVAVHPPELDCAAFWHQRHDRCDAGRSRYFRTLATYTKCALRSGQRALTMRTLSGRTGRGRCSRRSRHAMPVSSLGRDDAALITASGRPAISVIPRARLTMSTHPSAELCGRRRGRTSPAWRAPPGLRAEGRVAGSCSHRRSRCGLVEGLDGQTLRLRTESSVVMIRAASRAGRAK